MNLLAPRHRLLFGMLLIPAFLLQQDLVLRTAQVALFMALALLSGRRIRVLQGIVISAGIVVMNLVSPYGRVLLELGPWPITQGALLNGLFKATTMVGLIYLSLVTIRSDLPLPGRFGGLVTRMVYYFERFLEIEKRIDRRNVVASLDALLFRVRGEGPAGGCPPDGAGGGGRPEARGAGAQGGPADRPRTAPAGFLLAAGLLLLNWGALVLGRVVVYK